MILEIDLLNASVSALIPVSITGIVVGIFKIAEFNEHKKSMSQWMEDTVNKMDKHETNDENRQKEVIERISVAEQNLFNTLKDIARK